MMKRVCVPFARRPFDTLLFVAMLIVGLLDVFGSSPFPPEIQEAAPQIFFVLYGAYLAIGSGLILAAIFHRRMIWARRVERLGLLLVAGATAVSDIVLIRWLSLFPVPTGGETLEVHATELAITKHVVVCIAVVCVGCIARWKFLGKVKPVGLIEKT